MSSHYDPYEYEPTGWAFVGSALGNALFSGVSFSTVFAAADVVDEMAEERGKLNDTDWCAEQFDVAVAASVELQGIIDRGPLRLPPYYPDEPTDR